MDKVVVDSSVIVKWLNQKEESNLDQAEKLFLRSVKDKTVQLITPELAKYEVGNVLSVGKKLESNLLNEALEFFYSIPIDFVKDNLSLSTLSSQLTKKYSITYYDASFTALAKQEKATLVTDNPKHQARVRGVKVIPLEKYR